MFVWFCLIKERDLMNILCFGDSNTWGYKPDKSGRYDENIWSGIDAASVAVSRNLANEYRKIALQNHAAFLNASDFAAPSVTDREHMDEKGHAALADAIYNKILALQKGLSHVI